MVRSLALRPFEAGQNFTPVLSSRQQSADLAVYQTQEVLRMNWCYNEVGNAVRPRCSGGGLGVKPPPFVGTLAGQSDECAVGVRVAPSQHNRGWQPPALDTGSVPCQRTNSRAGASRARRTQARIPRGDMPAGMEAVDRRRRFLQPKEGTQLPGYTGYCPQYRFLIGLTYGNVSAQMLKPARTFCDMKTVRRPRTNVTSPCNKTLPSDRVCCPGSWETCVGMLSGEETTSRPDGVSAGVKHNPPTISDPGQAGGPRLVHLPRFDGTRRLTEGMVPGYTGYIPRKRYKDAGTYGRDTALSIDEFFGDTKGAVRADRALRATVAQAPRLTPTSSPEETLEKMDCFMPRKTTLLEDKRSFLEAPMPGWTGYVPRKKITEVGLGRRYAVVAKKGFCEQQDHMDRHSSLRETPVTIERTESPDDDDKGLVDRRLYRPEGMVPKYTGYIPRSRYEFGNTYGATSRSLPVCYHDKPTFGSYLRSQALQIST
ncbi:Cat eye syndrome [Branchiostoma belcheri]|nr:Cat eye syndrome [Branchiostoma belcheri]